MTLSDRMQNMPLLFKILLGGIPILLVIIWFVNLQVGGKKHKKEFFRSEIYSPVIKSDNYYGRSVEFQLENGMNLYFMPPIGNKIKIGDLIRKEPNTYIYEVYRKNITGEYKYWTTYDRMRIY